MAKKIEKLSKISEHTLSVIKFHTKINKQAPLVSEVALALGLTWSSAMARIKTLLKAKKITRNKNGEIIVKK